MKKKKKVNVVVVKQIKINAVVTKKMKIKVLAAILAAAYVRGFLKKLKDCFQNLVVGENNKTDFIW